MGVKRRAAKAQLAEIRYTRDERLKVNNPRAWAVGKLIGIAIWSVFILFWIIIIALAVLT